MKSPTKEKGEEAAEKTSATYIMSVFKDDDVKKVIRAFVLSAEATKIRSPNKDTAKPADSAPYVAPK
eukprot:11846980-Ditylum_brightwellii.AAC.1